MLIKTLFFFRGLEITIKHFIFIIKRKNDHIHGFSINGLGFAGYLLVTEKSNINYLKKFGPEKLLESFV